MRSLFFVFLVFFVGSVQAAVTKCNVIGQATQGGKTISSIRIEKLGENNGRVHLLTSQGASELEVQSLEGQLKQTGGLIAFAGEKDKKRAAVMVNQQKGTVTWDEKNYPINCSK